MRRAKDPGRSKVHEGSIPSRGTNKCCDAATGTGPVLKIGDPQNGLGVRVPLAALMQ